LNDPDRGSAVGSAAALALALLAGASSPASATGTLSYQGFLTNTSGSPITQVLDLDFAIYDVSAGGTPLWSEQHLAVNVVAGVFSVELGKDSALSAAIFAGGDRWLGITIDGGDELAPRVPFTGVAFSFHADLAQSMPDGAITTGMIADGTITLDKLGDFCSPGEMLLMGAKGWICAQSPCTFTTEVCDGKDNDCDGLIDEGFPDLGQSCTAGLGACLQAGMRQCNGTGTGTQCSAIPGTPSAELCDGIDNDCDGEVDEDFKNGSGVYDTDQHCGNCATDCTSLYPLASGYCDTSGGPAICAFGCDAETFDLDASPLDGCEFVLDGDGIYVSVADPAAADDSTCGIGPSGTGGGRHPCATIGQGLTRAVTLGRHAVLVADGNYPEVVTVSNGVALLGGYHATSWLRHVDTTETVIQGAPGSGHRKTLIAVSVSSLTLVEGFQILGQDATTAGSNSYAVYVISSGGLKLQHDHIVAGNGSPALRPARAGDGGPGSVGAAGGDAFVATGATTCNMSNNRAGGSGGITTCGVAGVNGGSGGGNHCPPIFDTQSSASSGAAGSGGAAGGVGGFDSNLTNTGTLCFAPSSPANGASGGDGVNGSNGAPGAGCASQDGTVSTGEWKTVSATGGASGGNGAGGGGGGGGGGAESDSTVKDPLGGAGGGGGAGGCGGGGGLAGPGGGASIAVFVSGGSAPVIVDSEIVARFGGRGADGGDGGLGGGGGAGGAGGAQAGVYCADPGGAGGDGGDGGGGGGGGGGCGGAAFGVYTSGVGSPNYCLGAANNMFVTGTAGLGGAGGVGGNDGTSGAAGTASNCSFH
jgi:hypothetical protein